MATMIDWVTARLPLACDGPINGGSVVSLTPDGEVEWRTDRRLMVEGSHSANVTVRGGFGVIDFSGNPAKFLQGHNLFGISDLNRLMTLTMQRVSHQLGLAVSADDLQAWRSGAYTLSRTDLTRMIDCGTEKRALGILRVLNHAASTKYQRPVADGTTIYIGLRSRRQQLKFYAKGPELLKHKLPATMAPSWHQMLTDYAAPMLRLELTNGSKYFHESPYRDAWMWDATTPDKLLEERLAVLEVSDTMRLADEVVHDLPHRLMTVYDSWRGGRDLKAELPDRTFYRYRRQLLNLANIDIARVQPRLVVADNEYLGGEPVGPILRGPGVPIPVWAIGTDLLAS
jgi:II/X family phage/plasmid replication protein